MSSAARFTDVLRLKADEGWDRIVKHKFADELAAGVIDRDVLRCYLIQDHRFLDSFVVLLSSMISHARSLDDRIPGCQFLALITGKENTYFERSFSKLGCGEEERRSVPDGECTKKFIRLMREVAHFGTLGEMLAVLVVCEWSYLSWGERVLHKTNREDFVTYEWVDLHSGEYFAGVVEYLRGLLDDEGEILDEEGKEKCERRFMEAVRLEGEFFDYAYSSRISLE